MTEPKQTLNRTKCEPNILLGRLASLLLCRVVVVHESSTNRQSCHISVKIILTNPCLSEFVHTIAQRLPRVAPDITAEQRPSIVEEKLTLA